MEPTDAANSGFDLFRAVELAAPLTVTILLAWIAIRIEGRRARNDRRDAWRYDRTRVAVDEIRAQLATIKQHLDSASLGQDVTSLAARRLLSEASVGLMMLGSSRSLPLDMREALEALRSEGEFINSMHTVEGRDFEADARQWASFTQGALSTMTYELADRWAVHGEVWESHVRESGGKPMRSPAIFAD